HEDEATRAVAEHDLPGVPGFPKSGPSSMGPVVEPTTTPEPEPTPTSTVEPMPTSGSPQPPGSGKPPGSDLPSIGGGGFPSMESTGPTMSVSEMAMSDSITTDESGQVIEGLNITSRVKVVHDNVVVRD